MKCNPLRWLWGLLPLAVWTWITVLGEHERIEADLKRRTEEALANVGLGWAKTTFQGRDGILSGRALDDSEPQSALQTASDVYGVRLIDPQTDLIRKVGTYLWSAAMKDESAISLSGYVPNEATRKTIIGLVKARFPKSQIHDRLELARGVPNRDAWLGGVSFGLKQLAELKRGHVDITGLDMSLAGEARDSGAFKNVKAALRGHLPTGLKLASDKVSPPIIGSYAWDAHSTGSEVVLGGFMPTDQARDNVVARAKSAFPKAKVVDRMDIAGGAPADIEKAAAAAVDQLAALRMGEAKVAASQLTISGDAEDETTALRVRKELRSKVPGNFKTADTITFPKPQPAAEPTAAVTDRTAAEAEARRKADEAAAKRKAEDDARRAAEAEARRKVDEASAKKKAEEAAVVAARKAEADKCQTAMRTVASAGVIQFERASAALSRISHQTLDKLAVAANVCPTLKIDIEGYTDAEGTPERNQGLSERRAQSVLDYLVSAGVAAGRLHAIGYGEQRPVAPNDTPENRARNRRIEFSVKAD